MTPRWTWLGADVCVPCPDGRAIIEETAIAGLANVELVFPAGWQVWQLTLHEARKFTWLVTGRSADGLVLARRPDSGWEAHVVECKAKIRAGGWRGKNKPAFPQLWGSVMRLFAACGVAGFEVDRITLYTAFRDDQLGSDSANPELLALPIGERPDAAQRARLQERRDWMADETAVPAYGAVPHRKIQLEVGYEGGHEIGRATVEAAGVR